MNRVAEGKLAGKCLKPLGPFLDHTPACDEVDAGQPEFDRIDTEIAQPAEIALEALQFTVDGTRAEAGCDDVVHCLSPLGMTGVDHDD